MLSWSFRLGIHGMLRISNKKKLLENFSSLQLSFSLNSIKPIETGKSSFSGGRFLIYQNLVHLGSEFRNSTWQVTFPLKTQQTMLFIYFFKYIAPFIVYKFKLLLCNKFHVLIKIRLKNIPCLVLCTVFMWCHKWSRQMKQGQCQEEAPQLTECNIQNGNRKFFLTACWQFIPRFPFSPRTTFIRQCRVRPFRCNPEQWCSISPRQLRMISGLKEKSSINMRR